MLTSNTVLKDRYRIVQPLGRGGMGAVYQALDEENNRLVAVKETFATTDELRRAFRREAELLGNIHHPALPFVIEHFREGDGQFLVMQFIPGNNLWELLRLRETPLAVGKVLEWADQLLDALEEMHGNSPPIIHRDIKPSNLKLTPKGKIILLDFGLAKGFAGDMSTLGKGESPSSLQAATKEYAPLEQLRGTGTDPRCDLYSLGATLWTLLTNEVPPDALTRVAERGEGNPDPLRPAHELNPKVPPAVSEVLRQAMAISRYERPDTAADLRRALREAAGETGRTAEQGEEHLRLGAERLFREEGQRHEEERAPREATEEEHRRKAEVGKGHGAVEAMRPRRREGVEGKAPPAFERQGRADRAGVMPGTPVAVSPPRPPLDPAPEALGASNHHQSVSPQHGETTLDAPPPQAPAPGARAVKRNEGARLAALSVLASVVIVGALLWRSGQPVSDSAGAVRQAGPSAGQAAGKVLEEPTPSVMVETPAIAPAAATLTPSPPPGMVYVPGGTFTMGRDDGRDEYERPAHQVTLDPFFIDKYEVTNEEYAKFVAAKNWPPPPTWRGRNYPPGAARKPVMGVKWDDAVAYANWVGKRLPSEAEWEFAARGKDGLRYPWGNDWRVGLANAGGASGGIADVGTYKGVSPFGAFDMVGNAWEWTATDLSPYPKGELPPALQKGDLKVIRGGSYASNPNQATTTYRRGWGASGESDYSNTGFRCAKGLGGS